MNEPTTSIPPTPAARIKLGAPTIRRILELLMNQQGRTITRIHHHPDGSITLIVTPTTTIPNSVHEQSLIGGNAP